MSAAGLEGGCACGAVRTQLSMNVAHQPDTIDFTIATLDEPARVVPGFHLFVAERIEWFETTDRCARYAGLRPQTRGL